MKYREMVKCPSCGKQGVIRGLMGGACHFCGDTARDVAMKQDRQKRREPTAEPTAAPGEGREG